MKKKLIVALILITACSTGPKPIAYGETGCHFCKMTVVDQQHAAQLVTKKGKVFNFDASECLLNHLKDIDSEDIGHLLASDYNNPGELIPVADATFLISNGIPSPMGEYLTAFNSKQEALEAKEKHGGELYTWSTLRERF